MFVSVCLSGVYVFMYVCVFVSVCLSGVSACVFVPLSGLSVCLSGRACLCLSVSLYVFVGSLDK